jgi:hypothetical protein
MMELADYNIQLWMDLKANIRTHGIESPKYLTGMQFIDAILSWPSV